MIDKKEFEKYCTTTGFERIVSFISLENNTEDKVIDSYNDNIKISQALYPELSVLEITLRNAIDTVFKRQFGENWLEN